MKRSNPGYTRDAAMAQIRRERQEREDHREITAQLIDGAGRMYSVRISVYDVVVCGSGYRAYDPSAEV